MTLPLHELPRKEGAIVYGVFQLPVTWTAAA